MITMFTPKTDDINLLTKDNQIIIIAYLNLIVTENGAEK